MELIEIRPAADREELEQAYDIWGTVFPEDRAFFQKRLDYDLDYTLDTTWIALVNGRMAAAIQIFPYTMYWGSVTLKVGGIGSVATLPEYRRRGLAQHILRMQCGYMRARGYDLSLLMTGINSFYKQVGWHTILKQEWIADAHALRKAGSPVSKRIRKYEDGDLERIQLIYDEQNQGWIAPTERSGSYWQGQSKWGTVDPDCFLVAEDEGIPCAYLRYVCNGSELRIRDCCYQPGKEQAALDLLLHALKREEQSEAVRAGLPSDHILADFFHKSGAKSENDSGYMWRTFALNDTLAKMAPELAQRLSASGLKRGPDPAVSLLFTVGNEQSLLKLLHETVKAEPPGERVTFNAAFQFTEEEWITLLLKGFGGLEQRERIGAEYLQALFPERPFIFWHADHF